MILTWERTRRNLTSGADMHRHYLGLLRTAAPLRDGVDCRVPCSAPRLVLRLDTLLLSL